MLFLVLKLVHVLGAVLFLGTGLGSFYYKARASASGDVRIVAWCDREIVLADWVMTVPSAVVVPFTGLWMVQLFGLPLTTPWVMAGLVGYAIAGLTWLPAARLQIVMRDLSAKAAADGAALPEAYRRAQRTWLMLGFPSFLATMVAVWAMISKRVLP